MVKIAHLNTTGSPCVYFKQASDWLRLTRPLTPGLLLNPLKYFGRVDVMTLVILTCIVCSTSKVHSLVVTQTNISLFVLMQLVITSVMVLWACFNLPWVISRLPISSSVSATSVLRSPNVDLFVAREALWISKHLCNDTFSTGNTCFIVFLKVLSHWESLGGLCSIGRGMSLTKDEVLLLFLL